MAEIQTPRLMAAAKEFNIGKDTLVEFLAAKGFNRDDLKPTAKLTEDMYRALQQEFQTDKLAKHKAEQIDLPKGATVAERKRKEDEDLLARQRDERKPAAAAPAAAAPKAAPAADWPIAAAAKAEAAPEANAETSAPKAEAPKPEPTPEPAPVVEEVKQPEPEVAAPEPAPAAAPEPVAEPEQPAPAPVDEPPANIEAPVVEGPRVLGTVDLSAIDSSTRPKKGAKKEEPAAPAAETARQKAEPKAKPAAAAAPEVQAPAAAATPEVTASAEPKTEEKAEPIIENIRAEKLEGPKILGKIELPVDSDTRPKPDEKRKRNRIPIKKAPDTPPARPGGGVSGAQGSGGGRFTVHRPGEGNRGRTGNQPGQRGGARGGRRDDPNRQIDEKEIQRKIQETQARLAGGGRKLSKAQRKKRFGSSGGDDMDGSEDSKLQVTEFISVSELANLMDVSFAEVISKCMGLGIMVSINQRLDAEVIELVASEFGYDVEFIDMEKQLEMDEEEDVDAEDELQGRPPIVTIMGHVDHGKTSLLDYIRNATVVAGEAGGITQHIGAYQVHLPNGRDITFLDTPGHEAFTAMRARGAKVTDIAVIVIAADDAIMPQTREAISHAQAAGVPMIFAINKIDKDGANPTKIYEQLAGMNLLVESWGGKYQSQELSAKKGTNVELLLEKILLEADILDVKANPDREASGNVIEASLDKGRGYVTTVLVQNGTLRNGDLVVSGQHYGRVKAMFNERNKKMKDAGPSVPVVILGLNGAPQAGEKFRVYEDEAEAKEVANRRAQILREQGMRAKKHITLAEIGRRLALGTFKELKVIIKGDVDGSVEALSDSLQKQSTEEILVSVIHKGVGQINESDIVLAEASDALIIGFNVRPSMQASKLAENAGIEIKTYSVIYQAIDEVRSAMEGLLEPKTQEKIVANVEIREVFKFDKATVAGCVVLDGRIKRDNKIRIIRDGIVVYPTGENANAELGSLKRYKDDVKEVLNGMECGLTIKNYNDIKAGDIVEAYELEEVKRTL
ncbi:MAG: translation initiation factor IF-2 [Chitinophagaceae bacterium]|nr:MAG: translation initiation factor IF-2 [Chitinophagaceae bacterium]